MISRITWSGWPMCRRHEQTRPASASPRSRETSATRYDGALRHGSAGTLPATADQALRCAMARQYLDLTEKGNSPTAGAPGVRWDTTSTRVIPTPSPRPNCGRACSRPSTGFSTTDNAATRAAVNVAWSTDRSGSFKSRFKLATGAPSEPATSVRRISANYEGLQRIPTLHAEV